MSNVENVRQMNYQHQNKWYPKGVYLTISKLYSILAVANLQALILVYVLTLYGPNSFFRRFSGHNLR